MLYAVGRSTPVVQQAASPVTPPSDIQILSIHFGWLWGSIEIASRGGQNVKAIGERVSHFALTTQGILTKCVHGVAFKGSTIDERCDWRWIPTTNQNVNDSSHFKTALAPTNLAHVEPSIHQTAVQPAHMHSTRTLHCVTNRSTVSQ
jgi:hypothetical protein